MALVAEATYRYQNIASATTTVVKTTPGQLRRLVINKPVASTTITIYDNTAASGTKIATIATPATLLDAQIQLDYGVNFATGLTIVTSGADDINVVYL